MEDDQHLQIYETTVSDLSLMTMPNIYDLTFSEKR